MKWPAAVVVLLRKLLPHRHGLWAGAAVLLEIQAVTMLHPGTPSSSIQSLQCYQWARVSSVMSTHMAPLQELSTQFTSSILQEAVIPKPETKNIS